MDKTAIKNYAIWARVQLIESCKQRAFEYGITEDGENRINIDSISGRVLTDEEKEQRRQLIEQISQKGYSQVMEEAAYTWFNRFIALRFMEVNGYLPSKVRVFTDEGNNFKPEILKEAMAVDMDGIDRTKVAELLEKQDNEALYKYLLITQCNALNSGLPYMFETISNWTELLFPINLLRNDSVIGQMIRSIPEEDWTDQVQIIGWLYQYYNSELKDETFALLKKNVKITKERIPAATQLFTPDWIVRYMVENSLGRLWYEGHKDFDKTDWKYYLDEAEQEPEVEEQLAKIREEYSKIKPEEIKVIDPCMGSGHILVYMFDVLMQIYTSAGWSERDAAKSILDNNLYGLDIDDRAGQLAYFAVMMKARKYNRRIMSLGIEPNVMSIQDSSFMSDGLIEFVAGNDSEVKRDLIHIKETFNDAKEYGSILNVSSLGYKAILERVEMLQDKGVEDVFQIEYKKLAIGKIRPLVKLAMIMSQKYDVAVTNPPYMGSSGMSVKLGTFVKKNYPDSKSDLFAVFIEKCASMIKQDGYQAMITQHAWMFLGSYEKLREKLLQYNTVNMAHLGARAFEEIGGEVVQTTSFVLQKVNLQNRKGIYCRLIDMDSQQGKENAFLCHKYRYVCTQNNFVKIPGSPIAYWCSDILYKAFISIKIGDKGWASKGIITGDNSTFLRLWYEVCRDDFYTEACNVDEAIESNSKWFPCNKGGDYRKWYGNNDFAINWYNNGLDIMQRGREKVRNCQDYKDEYKFVPAITWTSISSSKSSFRYSENALSESAGMTLFIDNCMIMYTLALLNSKVTEQILPMINPTLNYTAGTIASIPLIINKLYSLQVEDLASICITIQKDDWDSFETSWDFEKHPLI